MHKKIKIVLSALILLVLIGCGSYFLTKHKSSADTVTTNNLKLLASLTVNNDGSSGTIIKLSDKFTDDQIGATLSGTVTRSMGDDAVLKEIRQKAKELANQPIKGQSTTRSIGQQKFVGDLIIDVRNSKGEQITPLATRAVDFIPTTVADNFDFDASVSQSARQIFIDVYPKIEAIYGQRSNNKKIKVLYDTDLNRPYFDPSVNEIHIANGQDDITITHELTHAFHGDYCLISVWEEGMAQTVQNYINNFSSPSNYEATNTPQDDFVGMDSAHDYIRAYWVGQDIIEKLFAEDKNFFKNFNSILYQQQRISLGENFALPIAIASQVLPSIENQTSVSWFSRQYPLIPVNGNYTNKSFFPLVYDISTLEQGGLVFASYMLPSDIKSLNIKGYNSTDELEFECDQPVNSEHVNFRFSSCSRPYQDLNYNGLMKFVATTNNDVSRSFTQYAFVGSQQFSSPIFGTVISNINPTKATVTNLDTSWKTTTNVANKGFYFTDSKGAVPGRYKIDLVDSKGSIIKTQYFNKRANSYEVQVFDLPNDCSLKDMQAQAARGGINILANLSKVCFDTLSLNGFPVERGMTVNYKTSIKGLVGEQAYNLGLNYTNGLGNTDSVSKTITTLKEFKITNQENIGVASLGTFRRRLTFTWPVDPNSDAMTFSDAQTQENYFIDMVKVNDYTWDFVPEKNLQDNRQYIQPLFGLVSMDGDHLPIGIVSVQFATPPAPVVVVKYTVTPSAMNNGTISPSGVQTTDSNKSITYTATPASGYVLSAWFVDGKMAKDVIDAKDLTYTLASITANHTILAAFTKISTPPTTYTITPLAMTNGSISPNSTQTVMSSQNITFTAKPTANYNLDAWFVDGKMVKDVINAKDLTYTLNNITANHTILAIFTINTTVVSGSLKGQVLRGGKPVVGDTVTVKNLITNVIKNTTTDRTGNYSAGGLSVGKYNISATLRVCKKYFWFINICSNSTKTQPVTVVAGKIVTVPTIAF